jgi:hypothetical protein
MRPVRWASQETLPLVVPEDLFTSSAGEEDDQANLNGSFSKSESDLQNKSGPLPFRLVLFGVVFASHLVPFAFVVPLLNDFSSPQLLVATAAALTVYFAFSAIFAALSAVVTVPLFFARSHWIVGALLSVKCVLSICFGLVASLDRADTTRWMVGAMPLFAVSGVVDGTLSIAAECLFAKADVALGE